jgi:hypothetical protein
MTSRADMLFIVELAVRYHRRRAAFLERADQLLTFATVAAGGGAFVSVVGDNSPAAKTAALIVMIIGVIQLVYKPEACAGRHRAWLARYLRVLTDIRNTAEPKPGRIETWVASRYELEAECVGEMRALQVDCYNRTMRALRLPGSPKRLRWWHRMLIQLVSFEHAFEKKT